MRIILKISGEFVSNKDILSGIVSVIEDLFEKGHKIGIVVGGGNLVRGRDFDQNRVEIDKIGIYSTLINGLVLKAMLSKAKIYNSFKSSFIEECKIEEIENNIIIFTGGVGVPYFSTDTAAVIRALDIDSDLILKATKVDGVYDKDPSLGGAHKYEVLNYKDILDKELNVIDLTAASLALSHGIDMVVFDGRDPKNIYKAMEKKIGTIIKG